MAQDYPAYPGRLFSYVSGEGGYPSPPPRGSDASPLTYSFSSSFNEYPVQLLSLVPDYNGLTQLSPCYPISPIIPTPHRQSPWSVYPVSGPSSGGYHHPSQSPPVPTAQSHMAGYYQPGHAPRRNSHTHKQTSLQRHNKTSNSRHMEPSTSKTARQKPPLEQDQASFAEPQERAADTQHKTSSDKPTTEGESSAQATEPAAKKSDHPHNAHTSTDTKQGPSPRQQAKSLGHIRTVTDTVTGLPKYTLDPFCPSNMEFQRRGEDEVAKFFHKVIEFASEQKDLQLNYEDPESRKVSQNPTRVIGVWSLDFRWQMKHLLYNRSKYSSHVFNGLVSESYIMQRCRQLKDQADEMAHKQHLMDNLRQKGVKDGAGLKEEEQVRGEGTKQRRSSGTRRYIQQFFETAIEFTEEIERSTRHKPLKGLHTHLHNLRSILQTFEEHCHFRKLHYHNLDVLQSGTKEEKQRRALAVLMLLQDKCRASREKEEWQMHVARMASLFDLDISCL